MFVSKKTLGLIGIAGAIGLGSLLATGLWIYRGSDVRILPVHYSKSWILTHIQDSVRTNKLAPTITESADQTLQIEYALDARLQDDADSLLHHYQPDHGAIVVMDAKSGRVLAMSSFNRQHIDINYAITATFPAASVFKLVTATAALDQNMVTPDTVLPFNGASHTLYKRNVLNTDLNRWTNYMTLKDAFAHSVNTFFGKLGLFHVGTDGLARYAQRYGFNHTWETDFPIDMSVVHVEGDGALFSIAEAASGYTRNTTLSPVQGALMAASVVNDGAMMEPFLVRSLRKPSGEVVYQVQPRLLNRTMKIETAELVRELMRNTVERGTSRKAFRHLFLGRKAVDVDIGGKTGSLTGLTPRGRTDWFIGYLKYHDEKLAFAAVTVHERLWRVRSSQLASEFFKKYLGEPRSLPQEPDVLTTSHSEE
jgi:cell division protein FtsI/penicillin-binding protein 2